LVKKHNTLIFQNISTLNHMQIIIRLKFRDVNKKNENDNLNNVIWIFLGKVKYESFFLKRKNYNVVKKLEIS
jgi:hypothetical protein